MPICTFSNDYDAKDYTLVDNTFITHCMPIMTETEVKVYLFGLMLCHNVYGADNNLDGICKGLNLKNSEVKKAFEGMQNKGLVTITSTYPLTVRYNLPTKALRATRTYNPDKYSDFILNIQQLFVDKELSENDLHAFVDFLVDSKMEDDALVMIARYCIDLKGKNISRNYVLTVARSWLQEGCLTVSDVEKRFFQVESVTDQIKQILHGLKSKRGVDIEDRELFLKWTSKLGFTLDAILAACRLIKKGGMTSLDELLEKFAEQNVFTKEDIKAYAERREQIEECTKNVLYELGLRYQDYTVISDETIAPLFAKGFTGKSLHKIARYCRLNSTRDIQGFEKTVDEFYRGGYITEHSIDLQLDALTRFDENIQNIIYATGSSRKITAQDRDLYRTWVVTWGINEETVLKIATQSQGKAYAMGWISSKLSDLRENASFVPDLATPERSTQKQEGKLSDFEKADIREKLLEDSAYAILMAKKKKLDFEMSDYIFSDKTVPVTMQTECEELQKQIDKRIIELGYKPEDLR